MATNSTHDALQFQPAAFPGSPAPGVGRIPSAPRQWLPIGPGLRRVALLVVAGMALLAVTFGLMGCGGASSNGDGSSSDAGGSSSGDSRPTAASAHAKLGIALASAIDKEPSIRSGDGSYEGTNQARIARLHEGLPTGLQLSEDFGSEQAFLQINKDILNMLESIGVSYADIDIWATTNNRFHVFGGDFDLSAINMELSDRQSCENDEDTPGVTEWKCRVGGDDLAPIFVQIGVIDEHKYLAMVIDSLSPGYEAQSEMISFMGEISKENLMEQISDPRFAMALTLSKTGSGFYQRMSYRCSELNTRTRCQMWAMTLKKGAGESVDVFAAFKYARRDDADAVLGSLSINRILQDELGVSMTNSKHDLDESFVLISGTAKIIN